MEKNPKTLLKNVFGYDEFRPLQQEIIERALAGKDSFVLMPTVEASQCAFRFQPCVLKGLRLWSRHLFH